MYIYYLNFKKPARPILWQKPMPTLLGSELQKTPSPTLWYPQLALQDRFPANIIFTRTSEREGKVQMNGGES